MIAISGLACALATKTLLEQNLIQGTVVLYGTPAEESTSGKITFVQQGLVKDRVDVAMMMQVYNTASCVKNVGITMSTSLVILVLEMDFI